MPQSPLQGPLTKISKRNRISKMFHNIKDVQSRSGVTRNGAELLQSGRELTTKWEKNLGLSSCTVPRSAVACVIAYFRRTELLPGVSERSEDRTRRRCK